MWRWYMPLKQDTRNAPRYHFSKENGAVLVSVFASYYSNYRSCFFFHADNDNSPSSLSTVRCGSIRRSYFIRRKKVRLFQYVQKSFSCAAWPRFNLQTRINPKCCTCLKPTTAQETFIDRWRTCFSKVLLEAGINPDTRDSYDNTPLLLACETGNYDVAKLLVDNGANVGLYHAGGRGTALHHVSTSYYFHHMHL
jgi:hypothetical protein